ncbi:hypothetical protein N656DRAFT_775530 [Canariomyces notabilis]|uniref:DSBA-like thioredoxin domain-containing protein n=1 Tax=Canariomyces notabilis TaxID=2074819 RepID=A0AAN6YVT6_9PEZI|nr:hypothetical protein N656DRAFT_775530 [Canariomyces arenarius]
MARPKITHYVDMLSPFSYTAYHILRHDAVFMECDITHVPVSLVGLMQKCGNTPPIMIKNKDHWTRRERLRWASAFSVPMTVPIPPDFPGPAQLPIMRALCVVSASRQGGGREGQDHGQNQDQDQTHLFHRALDVFFAKQWGPNAVATHNEPGLLQTTLRDLFGAEEAARSTPHRVRDNRRPTPHGQHRQGL